MYRFQQTAHPAFDPCQ